MELVRGWRRWANWRRMMETDISCEVSRPRSRFSHRMPYADGSRRGTVAISRFPDRIGVSVRIGAGQGAR